MNNTLYINPNLYNIIDLIRAKYQVVSKNIKYDNDYKCFISSQEKKFTTEFILTKNTKQDIISYLMKYIQNFHENNVANITRTIIIYNFQYIPVSKYYILKYIFETYTDFFIFILTSDACNNFLLPFFKIEHIDSKYNYKSEFNVIINNDINNFYENIIKQKEIDFSVIRKSLYVILTSYFDVCLILKYMISCGCKMFPEHASILNTKGNDIVNKYCKGNKDILYLENFILILIKTCHPSMI